MRKVFCMPVLFSALFCLTAMCPLPARSDTDSLTGVSSDSLRVFFAGANEDYARGDYERAAQSYEKLITAGLENKDLYYNLGNTFYRIGDLGRAVLFYEKALRMNPRDADAKKNIMLVRSLIKDKQFVKKEMWVLRPLTWVNRNLNLNEVLMLTSVLYLLFCILAVGFIFMDSRFVAAVHARLSQISPGRLLGLMPRQDFALAVLLTFILFAASGALSLHKVLEVKNHNMAVVLEPEVLVYSAPSEDSTLEFKIHAGTKVKLEERRSGWVRISLPGSLSGWISKNSAEKI